MINKVLWLWVLWYVFWEDILWSINICAESKIVDFSNVPLVQVFSNQKLEKLLRWWDEGKYFHNSSELLSCDMATVSSIIILQLRLDKDSFVLDLGSNTA